MLANLFRNAAHGVLTFLQPQRFSTSFLVSNKANLGQYLDYWVAEASRNKQGLYDVIVQNGNLKYLIDVENEQNLGSMDITSAIAKLDELQTLKIQEGWEEFGKDNKMFASFYGTPLVALATWYGVPLLRDIDTKSALETNVLAL